MPQRASVAAASSPLPEKIWLADHSSAAELYSNGLRIETAATTESGRPLAYRAALRRPGFPLTDILARPAGIVFHTSEGYLAGLEPSRAATIRRNTGDLVKYIQRRGSYQYLIDRFGRVHRLLPDTRAANHAGQSVWADPEFIYVNLNSSFLGVCFESMSQPVSDEPRITPAQIHSGRLLVAALRSKHGIAAANCVTHAQVSVNPARHLIGYHTDWAANFPFVELGLPDNYAQPPAGIALFGFTYDTVFIRSTGPRLWAGAAAAECEFRRSAERHGVPLDRHRRALRAVYQSLIERLEP